MTELQRAGVEKVIALLEKTEKDMVEIYHCEECAKTEHGRKLATGMGHDADAIREGAEVLREVLKR